MNIAGRRRRQPISSRSPRRDDAVSARSDIAHNKGHDSRAFDMRDQGPWAARSAHLRPRVRYRGQQPRSAYRVRRRDSPVLPTAAMGASIGVSAVPSSRPGGRRGRRGRLLPATAPTRRSRQAPGRPALRYPTGSAAGGENAGRSELDPRPFPGPSRGRGRGRTAATAQYRCSFMARRRRRRSLALCP